VNAIAAEAMHAPPAMPASASFGRAARPRLRSGSGGASAAFRSASARSSDSRRSS
jgi:hypothetical protein